MDEIMSIRLERQLAEALKEEARRSGMSKGQIAREALEMRLQRPTRAGSMRRHFGQMTGPADLSTNREYRQNWGKGKKK